MFRGKVVGQHQAKKAVALAYKRKKSWTNNPFKIE